ncbi:hypothetical protein BD413DRAFT_505347 [Trametes elegans]|nr:hypothetical protein BD413DRAFT_505347 [Trametes elegans]
MPEASVHIHAISLLSVGPSQKAASGRPDPCALVAGNIDATPGVCAAVRHRRAQRSGPRHFLNGPEAAQQLLDGEESSHPGADLDLQVAREACRKAANRTRLVSCKLTLHDNRRRNV